MNCRLKHPQSKSLTIKFIFLSYIPPQPMKKEASQCNYITVRPTIVKICLNFSLTAGHGCRHSTHNGRYCPPVKCTELKNIYLSPNRRESFLRRDSFMRKFESVGSRSHGKIFTVKYFTCLRSLFLHTLQPWCLSFQAFL